MLEVRELSCERGERCLFDKLNFALEEGETLELRGVNGAGKSTLLRIISGLAQSFTGEVLWRGQNIIAAREEYFRRNLFLGHRSAVKPMLTVAENLRWLTELKGPCADQRARQALQTWNIASYSNLPCYKLSAGQQRRVALARLLTTGADIWILDEPFTALDSNGVSTLETLLAEHCERGGIAVVASHQNLVQRSNMKAMTL